MKRVFARLRRLPLRSKLGLTMVGGGFAVLVVVAFFSFRYWHDQLLDTSREQALLAATTAQLTLESALAVGDERAARETLEHLAQAEAVTLVRLHGADGRIALSSDPAEEGVGTRGAWIPRARELSRLGVARTSEDGNVVHVFVPLELSPPAVMELRYSMAPLRAAVRRGMWMGVGLVLLGILALGFVVTTMLEREVVGPLQRMEGLLAEGGDRPRVNRSDELQQIEASMVRLIRDRHEGVARAAERDRQLEQREGFAQVGELAAEMAHEFKRPLASIRSAMDLLEQEYVFEPGSRDVLEAMNQQLERLSDTMRDLFSLARPATADRATVDVPDLVDDALVELAGHPALRRVRVERDHAGEPLRVEVEPRRIQQAVQNVVLNAAEAMPDGGVVTVSTRAEAGYVAIGVRDTGVGMTPEAQQQALRPFHSTKAAGTGLGLPLVVRIVRAHGGELAIDSVPGQGTTVWLRLPARIAGEGTAAHAAATARDAWVSAS